MQVFVGQDCMDGLLARSHTHSVHLVASPPAVVVLLIGMLRHGVMSTSTLITTLEPAAPVGPNGALFGGPRMVWATFISGCASSSSSLAPFDWQPLHVGSDSRLGHPCCYLRGTCKFPDLGSGVAFVGLQPLTSATLCWAAS